MKVELKKCKVYPRLSKETIAFNAEVWIDGKKAGDVENDGNGGNNRVYFADRKLKDKFSAYCKSLPPDQSEYGPLDMDDDLFISLLVEEEQHKDWLRRQAKTKVVFTLPKSKKGEYRTVKFNPGQRDKAVEYIRTKYPAATIHA